MARENPKSATVHDADASREWNRAAGRAGCAMCRHRPPSKKTRRERAHDLNKIDGHHCIPKQDLKRWGLHALLWDQANMLPLCRYHHGRHEHAIERVPRELLTPEAFAFADEISARFVLEDDDVYPAAT